MSMELHEAIKRNVEFAEFYQDELRELAEQISFVNKKAGDRLLTIAKGIVASADTVQIAYREDLSANVRRQEQTMGNWLSLLMSDKVKFVA
jgi:hypothetical protein